MQDLILHSPFPFLGVSECANGIEKVARSHDIVAMITKRKQHLYYLNSKPRRSLYKLRLKFVQTTRVVCTDYS